MYTVPYEEGTKLLLKCLLAMVLDLPNNICPDFVDMGWPNRKHAVPGLPIKVIVLGPQCLDEFRRILLDLGNHVDGKNFLAVIGQKMHMVIWSTNYCERAPRIP